MRWRLALVGVGVAVAGILIGFYITGFLLSKPPTVTPQATSSGANITIQTVAAVGPQLSSNPSWVSYLIKDKGRWVRSTIWKVPANTLVHVTVYQFDGDSGLRNPFLAQTQGLIGQPTLNGKPFTRIKPDNASHTFAIPQLGVLIPLEGVPDNAKNQCGFAPCDPKTMAHNTITFTFRSGKKKGLYRWQCLVPCAAGFQFGFGGPMQTIGYMDGFIDVA